MGGFVGAALVGAGGAPLGEPALRAIAEGWQRWWQEQGADGP